MIEYEHQQDGSLKYVTDLGSGNERQVAEITLREGVIKIGVKEQNGEHVAQLKAVIRELSEGEEDPLVLAVNVEEVDKEIEEEMLGMMLILAGWFLVELGADEINLADGGMILQADDEVWGQVSGWLGESKMENFLRDGEADLEGGLAFELEMEEDWIDNDESEIKARINSADGIEAELEATIKLDDLTNRLEVKLLRRTADERWKKARSDDRSRQETLLNQAVNLEMMKLVGQEEWLMDDLTNHLLYLVGRYLKHQLLDDVEVFVYFEGAGPIRTILDEKVMFEGMSKWTGF